MSDLGDGLERVWMLLEAGRTEAALTELQIRLAADPHDAAALQLVSECRQRRGEAQPAYEAAMASVAASPDDPESHAQAGWSLLLLGRADTALIAFTEAIRLDPWGAHHFAHRALAHAARLDRRHAEADIARARELRPDDAQIVSIHGQVLTILGRTRQAHVVHAEALRPAPALGHVHLTDARAHLAGGRLDQAAGALTRALAANLQDDGSQAQIAELVLSVCRRLILLGWLGAAAAAWTVLDGASAAGRAGLAVGVVALGAVVAYLPCPGPVRPSPSSSPSSLPWW